MSSSIDELQSSIQEYENQIAQVNQAISDSCDDAEKESLTGLKRNLQELLLLTLETLNAQSMTLVPAPTVQNDRPSGNDDQFADEMALFMSEIHGAEAAETQRQNEENVNRLRKELVNIVGTKCSAPHTHAWGATAHHNALVCAADNVDEVGADNVKVKVLFTNPTHKNMIPCPFYLDGDCKFDAEKCRFSHGEDVPYADLKKYSEPDFELLNRSKCPVIAKRSDNVWHKARVASANFDEKTCRVVLEHTKEEISCKFVDVFPIVENSSSISSSDLSSDENDDYEDVHRAIMIEKSLMTPAPEEALGEWEKYTKGFGSRMLQKLGYIPGTGLGQNGEGIITPISAQILPPGRSLDHCMALREQANGDQNLFSVERKMKRLKKKQEAANVKAYARESKKTDVFSFINDSIFSSKSASTSKAADNPAERKDFKNHTNLNLNVEKFKLGEDIRRKEREIEKVQQALQRHKNGTPIHKQLNAQLQVKHSELSVMKKSESNMSREQSFRKDKTKMTVF